MMEMAFDERALRKDLMVRIRIVKRPASRMLMTTGLWAMKLGLLICGVGRVEILDMTTEEFRRR